MNPLLKQPLVNTSLYKFRPSYLSDLLYLGAPFPDERPTLGGLDDQPEGHMVVAQIPLSRSHGGRLSRCRCRWWLLLLTFNL